MSFFNAISVRPNRPTAKVELIAAGANTSLAIKSGRAWSWGNNSSGELGINSIICQITPVSVLGAVKTFCHISAGGGGFGHSLAIDINGRVWGWGSNSLGQLGNNSVINRCTPVSVAGSVKTFCKIIAGSDVSLAIDKNGRAWGWGSNSAGKIGNNSLTNRCTPVSVLGAVKTFCEISAGQVHSLAIDKNGRAWGWGGQGAGQIGNNSSATSHLTPVSVLGAIKTFCKISGGSQHSLAIDKYGRAWSWGFNTSGQLGNNSTTSRLTPVSVLGAVKTFCQISAGISTFGNYSLAIDKNGRAWGWGTNGYGVLGDNSTTNRCTPVSVAGAVKTFCKISAGLTHSIAIDKNGKVWGWGSTSSGKLGVNIGSTFIASPTSVVGATKTFCEIVSGTNHSLAIDKNGRAWGWGYNSNGQTGVNSTNINYRTPVSVLGAVKTFCQITAAALYSLAIDKNGRAWAWGSNSFGRLGDNSTTQRLTPVSVLGAIKTFCKIDAGSNHSLAIDKNGRAWAWGNNSFGALGDNSTTQRLTPVSVLGAIKTFCHISAGGNHSMAIDKNGRAWGWGYNYYGQLGINSSGEDDFRITPVSVLGAIKTFCAITAGQFHSAALDKNGRAWGWGYNDRGQIGDNSRTNRFTPVSVRGAVKTFCHISAGGEFTTAIDKNGRVWSWGSNFGGQLGDNSTTDRCTPVSLAGAVKTFCKISGGNSHSLAIDKNGRAWAWGNIQYGKLGNGQDTSIITPVRVCTI